MTFIDDEFAEKLREIEAEWMRKAFYEGCPTCGQILSELPSLANIYPHRMGACKGIKEGTDR